MQVPIYRRIGLEFRTMERLKCSTLFCSDEHAIGHFYVFSVLETISVELCIIRCLDFISILNLLFLINSVCMCMLTHI